jgi:hypothetical protein
MPLTHDEEHAMHTRREELRKSSREEAESIMKLAGFTILQTWELANGYWPDATVYDAVRRPWWLFLTGIGPVQLGWRKRVMHIQWDACKVRGIVTTDDTTKEPTYVHAWKTEKAVEYLKALRKMAVEQSGFTNP